MNPISIVYLLIGGNIGDRAANLEYARIAIGRKAGNIAATSAVYETEPWGLENQPHFLNQVLKVNTDLLPHELLKELQAIEDTFLKTKTEKYGARAMDIDILFFNDHILDSLELTVPHPQLQNRNFVLVPLAEIAPELQHPVFGKTIKELLNACPDSLNVYKFAPE